MSSQGHVVIARAGAPGCGPPPIRCRHGRVLDRSSRQLGRFRRRAARRPLPPHALPCCHRLPSLASPRPVRLCGAFVDTAARAAAAAPVLVGARLQGRERLRRACARRRTMLLGTRPRFCARSFERPRRRGPKNVLGERVVRGEPRFRASGRPGTVTGERCQKFAWAIAAALADAANAPRASPSRTPSAECFVFSDRRARTQETRQGSEPWRRWLQWRRWLPWWLPGLPSRSLSGRRGILRAMAFETVHLWWRRRRRPRHMW